MCNEFYWWNFLSNCHDQLIFSKVCRLLSDELDAIWKVIPLVTETPHFIIIFLKVPQKKGCFKQMTSYPYAIAMDEKTNLKKLKAA